MSLLNRSQVKAKTLEISKNSGRRFTRVGKSFIDHVERRTEEYIRAAVHAHPSIGVTLNSPLK